MKDHRGDGIRIMEIAAEELASSEGANNWLAAIASHDPIAVLVKGAVSPAAIEGARATADAPDAPSHDVFGSRITGSPMRLCEVLEEDAETVSAGYFESASRFRAVMARETDGPTVEEEVAGVLGRLAGRDRLLGAREPGSDRAYLPASIVTLYPGQLLPFHFDQRFFTEPTIFAGHIAKLGFERMVNYVVPIELPEGGGVIEFLNLAWESLGDDPSQALQELANSGKVAEMATLGAPMEVGDVLVLDAMVRAHRVTAVEGSRRITYTGSIGLTEQGGRYFV